MQDRLIIEAPTRKEASSVLCTVKFSSNETIKRDRFHSTYLFQTSYNKRRKI